MFGRKAGDTGRYNKVHTVIGEGTELHGTLQTNGTLRLDGLLEGAIEHAGDLVIGPTGKVVANVFAKTMAVAGEVNGDVVVEGRLELLPTARVMGDLRCGQLIVHEGAVFKGRSEMGKNQGAEAPATEAAAGSE